jgi:hypothetical protein
VIIREVKLKFSVFVNVNLFVICSLSEIIFKKTGIDIWIMKTHESIAVRSDLEIMERET